MNQYPTHRQQQHHKQYQKSIPEQQKYSYYPQQYQNYNKLKQNQNQLQSTQENINPQSIIIYDRNEYQKQQHQQQHTPGEQNNIIKSQRVDKVPGEQNNIIKSQRIDKVDKSHVFRPIIKPNNTQKQYISKMNESKQNIRDPQNLKSISINLASILRHKIADYNINISEDGYVLLNDILNIQDGFWNQVQFRDIFNVVKNDSKNRFTIIQNNQTFIKANDKHSIPSVIRQDQQQPFQQSKFQNQQKFKQDSSSYYHPNHNQNSQYQSKHNSNYNQQFKAYQNQNKIQKEQNQNSRKKSQLLDHSDSFSLMAVSAPKPSFLSQNSNSRNSNNENRNPRDLYSISKNLTWLLRHGINDYEIDIQDDGYVLLNDILNIKDGFWNEIQSKDLVEVVNNDKKSRFSIIDKQGKCYIRANAKHSISKVLSSNLPEGKDSSLSRIKKQASQIRQGKNNIQEGIERQQEINQDSLIKNQIRNDQWQIEKNDFDKQVNYEIQEQESGLEQSNTNEEEILVQQEFRIQTKQQDTSCDFQDQFNEIYYGKNLC